jgi:hypothetical protein
LAYEFIEIEKLAQKRTKYSEWTFVYDALLKNIKDSAENERNKNSSSFMIVANYLSAAILSKKMNIEYGSNENFVIDTNNFLDQLVSDLSKFNAIDRHLKITEIQTTFNETINKNQLEAEEFIKTEFELELKKINLKIDSELKSLLQETETLKKQLESNRDKYIENIQKIQRNMFITSIFGALSATASMLGFFGPEGAVVGGVLNIGLDYGKKMSLQPLENVPDTKIPHAVEMLKKYQNLLELDDEKKSKELLSQLMSIKTTDPKLLQCISESEKQLEKLIIQRTPYSIVKKQITDGIEELKKKYNISDSPMLTQIKNTSMLILTGIKTTINEVGQLGSEKDTMENKLKQTNENIEKVADYKIFVDTSVRSYLENLIQFMQSVVDGLKDSSSVALEISRYNTQKILREVKRKVNLFSKDFAANKNIIYCIESLDELMTTTITIYDRIQGYNDQIRLGALITNINTVDVVSLETGDAQLDVAIMKMDYILKSNMMKIQYNRAIKAFQQLVFPFAPLFLTDIIISENQTNTDSVKEKNLLQSMVKNIKNLQSKLKINRSTIIAGYDDQILRATFDERNPFFVWENNKQNTYAITDLLKGFETTMKADVLRGERNAVKFNDIRLKLKTSRKEDQRKLDAVLENFKIILTHMGNSRYRCNDNIFIISDKPQQIEYSFSKDRWGKPKHYNIVFDKIRRGDLLLSPYALWKFQIVKLYQQSNFSRLSKFYGDVKLELTGRGQYIKENSTICYKDLRKFYQFDEVTSKTNLNEKMNY